MMNRISKTFQIFSVAALAAFFSVGTAFAQGEPEITDEKLEAYVIVMDSVDALRAQLSEDISTMIKEHELMDGGRTFNVIRTAQGDSVKLAEEGITPEQIAAFEELQQIMTERQQALNETFNTLVKEQVGVSEYNAIRKGISSDEDLKVRYEAIVAEREGAEAATETEDGANSGEAAAE